MRERAGGYHRNVISFSSEVDLLLRRRRVEQRAEMLCYRKHLFLH